MSDLNKLGALWLKTSKSGTKFMTGVVKIGGRETRLVVFKNNRKLAGSKQPDYQIFESQPREERDGAETRSTSNTDTHDADYF